MSEIQIPAVTIPTMVKVAARMGLSVPRLLEQCDFDTDLLRITDDVIPFSSLNRFAEAMFSETGLPDLGLRMGQYIEFDYLPEFEIYITTSSTAREALRAMELFQKFSPFYDFELKDRDDNTWLTLSLSKDCPEHLVPVYIEMFFTLIDRFAKILLGDDFVMEKVIFGFRLNAPLQDYKKIFNAPIEAGATLNALVFKKSLLDRPLRNSLPQKNRDAETELHKLITGVIDKHGLKAQILDLMRSDVDIALGSVAQVAEKVGLSVRGLQRKLKEENTRFSQLQLEVRMEYAMLCLSREDLSIEKVSSYLGFSNRRSFSRAFHQWYGASPSNYRKLVLHGSLSM